MLLGAGATTDPVNSDGQTPLQVGTTSAHDRAPSDPILCHQQCRRRTVPMLLVRGCIASASSDFAVHN